jgi:hypothetical protein
MREFADFIAGGIIFLLIGFFLHRRLGRRSKSLLRELEAFFGKRDLNRFPVVTRSFSTVDLPNLHLAIAREVEARNASIRLIEADGME